MLKDSIITNLEDSTVVHENDDVRIPLGKQNHEILNRQVTQNYRNDFGGDTPLMLNELGNRKDFIMCKDNLQVDADDSEYPHLNKTTSIVVSEAFKVKNSSHTKAQSK